MKNITTRNIQCWTKICFSSKVRSTTSAFGWHTTVTSQLSKGKINENCVNYKFKTCPKVFKNKTGSNSTSSNALTITNPAPNVRKTSSELSVYNDKITCTRSRWKNLYSIQDLNYLKQGLQFVNYPGIKTNATWSTKMAIK